MILLFCLLFCADPSKLNVAAPPQLFMSRSGVSPSVITRLQHPQKLPLPFGNQGKEELPNFNFFQFFVFYLILIDDLFCQVLHAISHHH